MLSLVVALRIPLLSILPVVVVGLVVVLLLRAIVGLLALVVDLVHGVRWLAVGCLGVMRRALLLLLVVGSWVVFIIRLLMRRLAVDLDFVTAFKVYDLRARLLN